MSTSRGFKQTVYSGQGPFVDMKITMEAQVIAWGEYKGKLRKYFGSNGKKTINGVEVYEYVDLMNNIDDKDSDLYKLLELLGIDEHNMEELNKVDKADLDHMKLDFNGSNILSEDMLHFALQSLNNKMGNADRIVITGKTKTANRGITYSTKDPYYRGDTSIMDEYSMKLYEGKTDVTSRLSAEMQRAIIVARLLEKDDALLLRNMKKTKTGYEEEFDATVSASPFLKNYTKTYVKDKLKAPVLFVDDKPMQRFMFHIWGIVIHDSNDKEDKKFREWETKLAGDLFYYDKTDDKRYLTVEGLRKMNIHDMKWVSRFFNLAVEESCGLFCTLFGWIQKIIRQIALAIAEVISFGNEKIKQLFTAAIRVALSFALSSMIGGIFSGGMAASSISAMDLLSMGVEFVGNLQQEIDIDFNENLQREKNETLEEKIEDPIEMVKVDGVGDVNDWEIEYYKMYDLMFDPATQMELSHNLPVPEFGRKK